MCSLASRKHSVLIGCRKCRTLSWMAQQPCSGNNVVGQEDVFKRRNLQADIMPATRPALSAPKDNPKSGEGIAMESREIDTPRARKPATRDVLPGPRHRR